MIRIIAAALTLTAACGHTPPRPVPPPATTTPPEPPTTAATTTTSVVVATVAPTVTTTAPSEEMPGQDVTLEAIARCESGGRYDAENARSTASGKYQVLDATWNGYGGYERASDAPPEVQEAFAAELYARAGTAPWRASRSCWRRAA